MRMPRLLLVTVLLAAANLPADVAAEAELLASFDANGLAALETAGVPLLQDGQPRLTAATLESSTVADGDRRYTFSAAETVPLESRFDAAARRLEQRYAWGTLAVAYTPAPGRLSMAVTVDNRSPQTLADFSLQLLRLAQPAPPPAGAKPPEYRLRSGLDNVAVTDLSFGPNARLAAVCETVWPPLRFGCEPVRDDRGQGLRLVARGGVNAPEPGASMLYPHGLPRVAPGTQATFRFSLRVAAVDAPLAAVLPDVVAEFRRVYPPAPTWPDRRPLGMLMLASGAHRSTTNPRGWFNEPKIDVTTPAGRADFRKRALEYAARSVQVLTRLNAQGGIVWDIEGGENPHPITYIGDPRLAKDLAPEMDEVADEFFKTFTDAGLRTGVCIRPSQVYFDEEKKRWQHNAGNDGLPNRGGAHFAELKPADLATWKFFPVAERLCAKIEYARKRWGCTIFYIDTNGVHRPMGEQQKFEWALLTGEMLRRVRERYPDVLLVPELVKGDGHDHAAYWQYAAPYFELDLGGVRTPEWVRALCPGAFSVLNMSDGDFAASRAVLLDSVRRGDILLVHGWWSPQRNEEVRALYAEAFPGFAPGTPVPAPGPTP